MNYRVKFKITNCDGELGHPQAVCQSFHEEFHCDGCASSCEAEEMGRKKMEERYPGFKIECVLCCKHCIDGKDGGGCNVFDPADAKKEDTTEHARVKDEE